MSILDTCIITASTPRQAEQFRTLIRRRVDHGLYPREIDFRVYSDPESGRVGSGGGTLLALKSLMEDCGNAADADFFDGRRVLIVHAGGESRRMPAYVPEGKIFSPVPVAASSVFPPVILDLQLTLFLKYPWRAGEVVICSGDVVIDFDISLVPRARGDICGFAARASCEQGSRHGVYKLERDHVRVEDFLQKAPVDVLLSRAAFEGTRDCALDIGIVSLSPAAAAAFIALGNAAPSGAGSVTSTLMQGQCGFDLYLEILTACLAGITFEAFHERVRGSTRMEESLLRVVFDEFSRFTLSAVLTRSTTFLHFGSLSEFHNSCRELFSRGLRPFYVGEEEEVEVTVTTEQVEYNSVAFGAPLGAHKGVVAEAVRDSTVHTALGNNLFFGLEGFSAEWLVPEGICIDFREIDGRPVRLVYSIYDTFKPREEIADLVFCGMPMDEWLRTHELRPEDVWDEPDAGDLPRARLFPADLPATSLPGYWQRPPDPEWVEQFRGMRRYSLSEIHAADDPLRRDERRCAIRARVLRERLANGLGWKSMSAPDFRRVVDKAGLEEKLEKTCGRTDDQVLKSYRETLLDELKGATDFEIHEPVLEVDFLGPRAQAEPLRPAVKEDQIVWARCPVRLDLAGGWSDTPPYTLRHGGQVVNVAVNLNGQPPVQVFCRRTTEPHVRIHSIDLGMTETITDFGPLDDFRDPLSPFGLPRAALSLMGLNRTSRPDASLGQCLTEIGGGLEISLLCAVPKGSGVGTSSILGAVILAALHRFFGRRHTDTELFRQVLQMEQMLTTGGGWQDQIGGVAGGVKYIESKPGVSVVPMVHRLDAHLFEDPAFHRRFTLFYTGITRLAKHILRDVIREVNRNTPAYLFTLNLVRQLALEARDALGLRNYRAVTSILRRSWEANKRIHSGSTNEQVERLFRETAAHYDAVKLPGAGGGGYALFASAGVEEADRLRECLRRDFEDHRARIVEFGLNREGLQVTVS